MLIIETGNDIIVVENYKILQNRGEGKKKKEKEKKKNQISRAKRVTADHKRKDGV